MNLVGICAIISVTATILYIIFCTRELLRIRKFKRERQKYIASMKIIEPAPKSRPYEEVRKELLEAGWTKEYPGVFFYPSDMTNVPNWRLNMTPNLVRKISNELHISRSR